MLLVKYGVDFDTAFAMPRGMRKAWIIVNGQADGGDWDWEHNRWRKKT